MKVYVAGPDVFRPDAQANADKVKQLLASHGIEALIPIDNDVDVVGKSYYQIATEIYQKNVKMIDEADAVIANIEPFRGVHMDPGTAFEIGYAVARGKPVYTFTPYAGTPIIGRTEWRQEGDVHRDEKGCFIENFGETENLMIIIPSEATVKSVEQAVACLVRDNTESPNDSFEEHA